jgi:hypothetical protein
MGVFSDKKTSKNLINYECEKCDFKCSKKGDWNRHIATAKHLKLTFGDAQVTKKTSHHICEICNKKYISRNGLWVHKQKCSDKIGELKKDLANEEKQQELIEYLLKENSEFKQLMMEQNKNMLLLAEKVGNTTNNHNTTNSNIVTNNFNLQFYLNETCKNAMNIMDFVSQLQVGIKDLEETGRLGFAEGISKIFINGLKQINVNDRPIHCSDAKREILYIRSNNEWNKEGDNKLLLTNAIKHVANKNMKQIFEWTKEHPEYNDPDSRENDKYLQIVCESMCGSTQEETTKNYNKIIKNIVKETIIDK